MGGSDMRRVQQWTALAAVTGCLMLAAAAHAASMSVQVRETQVRGTPDFLGKIVGTLAYGDAVETSQTQGAWVKVSSTRKQYEPEGRPPAFQIKP